MSTRRSAISRGLGAILPPLVVFIGITLAAEGYLRWRHVKPFLVPTPTRVFNSLADVDFRQTLRQSTIKTAAAALMGFGASAIVGVVVAVLLSSSRIVRNALYPYTIFFQTIPVVAIAPMLVIWFEAGLQSVAICSFIVSVFPVIANTLAGLLSTDPALRDLFKLYGAGPVSRLVKLRLPWALPNIITGLRIAAGLSVIGAIVGEFVATELTSDAGLGVLIQASTRYGRTDRVFAAILAASILGLLMLCAVNLAGYVALHNWHASEQENG